MQNQPDLTKSKDIISSEKVFTKDEIVNLISKTMHNSYFSELLRRPICDNDCFSLSSKKSTLEKIINWKKIEEMISSPEFDSNLIPKLKITGSREDHRPQLLGEHLAYSFTQCTDSFRTEYYTSVTVAQMFDVHFSDDLFAEHIFDKRTKRLVGSIDIDKLIADFDWAKEKFVDETKEQILDKIRKVLIENSASDLTPSYDSYNNKSYVRTMTSTQEMLETSESEMIDQETKAQINYKCAENLINDRDRRLFATDYAKNVSDLDSIFEKYGINKEQQLTLVIENLASEFAQITTNWRESQFGNKNSSYIGKIT